MFGFGMQELAMVAVIAVIFFGPRQLPKLGRALGESIREFRGVAKALHGEEDEA